MRKVYGQSRVEYCNFCEKPATTVNRQGVPCCINHKEKMVEDKRCVCGHSMEVKKGKWGPFFLCPNCGPKSFSKAQEFDTGGFKLNRKFRN
ncbi:MAG: hypothetical protein ACOCZ6_01690 [Nanoarchaeota archaeon]